MLVDLKLDPHLPRKHKHKHKQSITSLCASEDGHDINISVLLLLILIFSEDKVGMVGILIGWLKVFRSCLW